MSDTYTFKFSEPECRVLMKVLEHAHSNLDRAHVGDSFDALARRIAKENVLDVWQKFQDVVG